jgi:signal transduction histidine kinase
MKILIVDDKPINLKLLCAQLEAKGHAVVQAQDGVEALELLGRQHVDVVISDILMPRMDGYRLCHDIRKNKHLCCLPVIIHSATYTLPCDVKLAFDVGADKYLNKPCSAEIIMAALNEVATKPHVATCAEELPEVEVLKEYNKRLVDKLEERNIALEQANLELSTTRDQMLRAQRLESIGTLACGVAHDINNALAPIMISTELLRMEFPDMASNYLKVIEASAKRGAEMVKQLLTFVKGVEGERLLVHPENLLNELEKLIQATFPKNIELCAICAKNVQGILGDATQLQQVLLNLCVNARDSMPDGGTLTLKVENVEIGGASARAVADTKPGPYVAWSVTDTGTGIPLEILDRIFEPFFSTKGPERGTGLGLSTVVGIVKSHGGFLQVSSVPGKGSTFIVHLPAARPDEGDAFLPSKNELAFNGNGETVLVVEDEAAVRNMMRAVLAKLNFKVLTASDGTAALIQVAENQAKLRVVITDLHMPNMDGLAFVRILKAKLPQAGIIIASGEIGESATREFNKLGVDAQLEKPFTMEKLIATLKKVSPR